MGQQLSFISPSKPTQGLKGRHDGSISNLRLPPLSHLSSACKYENTTSCLFFNAISGFFSAFLFLFCPHLFPGGLPQRGYNDVSHIQIRQAFDYFIILINSKSINFLFSKGLMFIIVINQSVNQSSLFSFSIYYFNQSVNQSIFFVLYFNVQYFNKSVTQSIFFVLYFCHQFGGKVKSVMASKPGEGILKAAEDEHASMIVLGSRGKGLLRRTFMGSVSDYVIHHSHVPVFVCKHPNKHIPHHDAPHHDTPHHDTPHHDTPHHDTKQSCWSFSACFKRYIDWSCWFG